MSHSCLLSFPLPAVCCFSASVCLKTPCSRHLATATNYITPDLFLYTYRVLGNTTFSILSIAFSVSDWQKWRTRTVLFSPTASLPMKVCEFLLPPTYRTHTNPSAACMCAWPCMCDMCSVWLGSHIN